MAQGPLSFDRIADRYEASRGGEERGAELARALSRRLPRVPRTLEVGVGTGVVAAALAGDGRWVAGVDLSLGMLRHAAARMAGSVAQADGARLPVATASVDAVVMVWVLQLVPEPQRLVGEAARVLRAGGRLAVVVARPDPDPGDEIAQAERPLQALRDDRADAPAVVTGAATAGLRLLERTTWTSVFSASPAEAAARIEARDHSVLWDLDQARWRAVVQPVIDVLRALPDPDHPRRRTVAHPLLIFEKPGRRP